MNILSTQYTLEFKSFDIYVAGCNGHCKGCHNPETWEFNQGDLYDSEFEESLSKKIKSFDIMIDNIMIFGGEPLDQDLNDVKSMLKFLKQFNKPIWLFTRFYIDQIDKDILMLLDYVKCGPYIESLKTDVNLQYGFNLATSNQYIIDVNNHISALRKEIKIPLS